MRNLIAWMTFLGLLTWQGFSYADDHHDWGHHGNHNYYHYHDHPRYGVEVTAFYPNEYYPVMVGGTQYYYDDGIYYDYTGGNYVVAQPPQGAVVSAIPSDFTTVNVNGVTYYTNNGTYYVYTSSGYKVVSPPDQSTYVVNVPSDKGGYVAITLKKSGNGYVGPQGEFYSQFPQVSQLHVMYGK